VPVVRRKGCWTKPLSRQNRRYQFGCYGYVVEIDIKGFFDHIDHDWLLRMLRERVDDRPFLRLIEKWLKAGVLEEDAK
jgi:RNA-directed DNA polymerase